MRHFWVLAFIAVAFWGSPAWSYGCGDMSILSTTKEDGTKIGIRLSDQQIESTPKWSPRDGAPPLALTLAIEIATQWAEREYIRYDSVNIRNIDLQEIGCSMARGHWVYIFHFRPEIDGNSLWGSGNFAAVLMDGTVVEPKEIP